VTWLALILAMAPQQQERPNCKQPRNQVEINFCIYAEYERADAEMNRRWKKTLAITRSDPWLQQPKLHGAKSDAQLLVEAQRAWLRYRDAQCNFEERLMPGTGGPSTRSSCLATLTEERTKYLRDMYPNPK